MVSVILFCIIIALWISCLCLIPCISRRRRKQQEERQRQQELQQRQEQLRLQQERLQRAQQIEEERREWRLGLMRQPPPPQQQSITRAKVIDVIMTEQKEKGGIDLENNSRACIEENKTCPICLDEIEIGQSVISTVCSHPFHAECFKQWANDDDDNDECPVCRHKMWDQETFDETMAHIISDSNNQERQ